MKLNQLLERLEYQVAQGSDEIEVTTLINDSRKVEKGSVFVCISGAVSDGHKYIPDVAEKGAAAVVVERDVEAPENMTVIRVEDTRYALALMSAAYFGYPAEKLKVIGITGTKGKTTTTYMIKSILDSVGYKVGLIGTIEAIIGEKRIPAANTTPESYTIQQYFAQMVEEGCDCVVMEVSSQGLMLNRTAGIPFDARGFCSNSAKWASQMWMTSISAMYSRGRPAARRPLAFRRKRISGRRMYSSYQGPAIWAWRTMCPASWILMWRSISRARSAYIIP